MCTWHYTPLHYVSTQHDYFGVVDEPYTGDTVVRCLENHDHVKHTYLNSGWLEVTTLTSISVDLKSADKTDDRHVIAT